MSSTEMLLDAAATSVRRSRCPDTTRAPPKNKGLRFPADPPPVEEIVAVMRATGNSADGARLRALIIVLWRAGLRISERSTWPGLTSTVPAGPLLCAPGRAAAVGMDPWAWDPLTSYLEIRAALPVGALFCVLHGPTAGRRWEASAARKQLRRTAETAGVRRRFTPH
jgi:integrase